MTPARRVRGLVRSSRLATALALLVALWLGPAVAPAGAATCANEALRIEDGSTSLPDCRAYELVSPPYKQGYQYQPASAASNGQSLSGYSLGSFADTGQEANLEGSYYELSRGPAGWQALAIDPPAETSSCGEPNCYATSSADGETSLWVYKTQTEPRATIYRREGDGSFVAVGPAQPKAEAVEEGGAGLIVGASTSLSTVVFKTGDKVLSQQHNQVFWPGDATIGGRPSLYQYTATASESPQLVGVRGAEASTVSGDAQLISQCGTELGSTDSAYNAVSAGGSVVFFTSELGPCQESGGAEHGSGPAVNELWARVDGRESVPISEPTTAQCATCQTADTTPSTTEAPAFFQGASESGKRVFFTTEQELLPGASGENLYEYDFEAPEGDRVSLVTAAVQPSELKGIVRISPDGARVYYVAGAILANNVNDEGASAEGAVAQGEPEDLYVYDTEDDTTQFVATVWSEADATQATEGCEAISGEAESDRCYDNLVEDTNLWFERDERPAASTEDGQFLVFQSGAHITADDSSEAPQVFEYDALDGELTRVSRGQAGTFDDDGNRGIAGAAIGSPTATGDGYEHLTSDPGASTGETHLSAVSADGSEVFFTSGTGLTPGALNDVDANEGMCEFEEEGRCEAFLPTVFAANVYEYESAEGHIADGSVSLISQPDSSLESGAAASAVRLYGTDASGDDVFFSTADALVGQDTDTQVDVYDARVEGGFPAPLPPPAACEQECQGPLSPPPLLTSPATTSQPGGGNLVPPATVKSKRPTKKKARATAKRKAKKKAKAKARKKAKAKARKKARTKARKKATRNRGNKKAKRTNGRGRASTRSGGRSGGVRR